MIIILWLGSLTGWEIKRAEDSSDSFGVPSRAIPGSAEYQRLDETNLARVEVERNLKNAVLMNVHNAELSGGEEEIMRTDLLAKKILERLKSLDKDTDKISLIENYLDMVIRNGCKPSVLSELIGQHNIKGEAAGTHPTFSSGIITLASTRWLCNL